MFRFLENFPEYVFFGVPQHFFWNNSKKYKAASICFHLVAELKTPIYGGSATRALHTQEPQ